VLSEKDWLRHVGLVWDFIRRSQFVVEYVKTTSDGR
jgi:hypothetical protein